MEPEQHNQPADADPDCAADAGPTDEMLCTEHLLGDLRGRAVRGGGVMLVSQGIKFAVKIGSTMVLARILVPEDFGLVAMVVAIANFVMIFKDAGLTTATVQSPRITREQVTTLFWLNAGLSFAVMAVLMAASPLVAALYGEPRLMLITIGFAVPVLLGGLGSQHRAILQRNMRFVALAVTEVVPIVIGVTVAIVLAMRGFGYWALVAMPITTEATATLLCWAVCPWRPGARAPLSECKKLLGFGGNLTGFSVLNYFTRNMDNIVIGATLGPGLLGFYAKSYDLLLMPIRQINVPLNGVVLPALSRLQDEPERFRRFFLRAISLISFATIGIVGIVVADTRNFVLVVLGDQWIETVEIFRWLGPAAVLGGINIAPGWICTALGRTSIQLRWSLISSPVMITAFFVGVQFGIIGVAIAFSASWSAMFILLVFMACKDSPVSAGSLLGAITPALAGLTVGGGLVVWSGMTLTNGLSPLLAFMIHSVIYSVAYTGVWASMVDVRSLIKTFRDAAKKKGAG